MSITYNDVYRTLNEWSRAGHISSSHLVAISREIVALAAAPASAAEPDRVAKLEQAQRNTAHLLSLMGDGPTDRHALTYTNYRGETSRRELHLVRIYWGSTDWHPEPQLLLKAFDYQKDAYRDFAVSDFTIDT